MHKLTLAAAVLAAALAPVPVLAHDHHASPTEVAQATDHDHGAMDQPMDGSVIVGDLTISGAFARATLPNAPVGGGFFTIVNGGSTDDRLISAASPAAGEVQLHEMKMDGDVMKMSEMSAGIPVPAGETVTLKPGGLHLMFMALNAPFVEGATIPVTLTFETAGSVDIQLRVGPIGASAPMEGHDMGGAMHGAGGHDHHASAVAVDQSRMSDADAIAAMQAALFDTPDNPLDMGPIAISGDYAVSSWAQGETAGRALLRKTASGWAIHLCSGAGLKDAANLAAIGVPEDRAEDIARQLAAAEAALPDDLVARYDAFDGTMMVDESLI